MYSTYFTVLVGIGGHLVRYPWSAISDWAWYRDFRCRTERAKSDIISDFEKILSDNQYPTFSLTDSHSSLELLRSLISLKDVGSNLRLEIFFVLQCRISEWTLMSISEHFRYRNDIFQSDIFVSDIAITDVDVGCRISPTLRSMSMPTYAGW